MGPAHKRAELPKAEGAKEVAIAGSAMDVFYTPEAEAASPEDLWTAAPRLKLLLDSKVKPKPVLKQPCGILPSVQSAYQGYGWIVDEQARRQRRGAPER